MPWPGERRSLRCSESNYGSNTAGRSSERRLAARTTAVAAIGCWRQLHYRCRAIHASCADSNVFKRYRCDDGVALGG